MTRLKGGTSAAMFVLLLCCFLVPMPLMLGSPENGVAEVGFVLLGLTSFCAGAGLLLFEEICRLVRRDDTAGGTSTGASTVAGGGRGGKWLCGLGVGAALMLFGCVLLVATQGTVMAKTLILFSPVTGQVLINGEPVAGAQIERSYQWTWNDEKGKDAATTGPRGEFSLPKIECKSWLANIFPHEPVVDQTILIRYAGQEYVAWRLSKHSYDENSELGTYAKDGVLVARPIKLTCRLETAPRRQGGMFGVYGICDLE